MVKKIIAALDYSKTSGPNCIAMVLLKNCEPYLSYILGNPSNTCLRKPYSPDCWKLLSVALVQECCERSSFCFSEIFEKPVNMSVGYFEKWGLFSDFQYGFRFSRPNADLLIVLANRFTRVFNIHGVTPGSGMLVLFTNLNLLEFLFRFLALFLYFSVTGSLCKSVLFVLGFLKAPF